MELDKLAFESCVHAHQGCEIYKERPESCRVCECAYIQMPYGVPEELRPDQCGIIFERDRDSMVGTVIGPVSAMARNQIKAFQVEGFQVVIQNDSS